MLKSPFKTFGTNGLWKVMATALLLCTMGCEKNTVQPKEEVETPTTPEEPNVINPNPLVLEESFTVMSFNLRNPTNSDPFTQLQRMSKLTTLMNDNEVDILGVQELANNDVEEYVNSAMDQAGYAVYKTGAANGSPKSIFYKKSRFTLVNAGHLIKEFVAGTVISSAKWVILKEVKNNNEYFVINSHWYHTADAGEYRKEFAQILLDCIKANHGGRPVICLGDFNAIPGTTEINTIKNADGFNMVDALMESQGDPTFHNWTGIGTKKIDYVMSTRDLAFRSYKVVKDKYTVDGKTMWPSDHFPVFARYIPAIFGAAKQDASAASTDAKNQYYFADVNGDGKKDKISWNAGANGGKVSVYLANGSGGFQSTAIVHDASASTSADSYYYFADVNGDKKADLIRWNKGLVSGKTQVYLASNNGSFSATAIDNPEGTSAGTTTKFYFSDVNGDGMADKIYWNSTHDGGNIRVYLATGDGNFSGSVKSSSNVGSTTARTNYYFADINGDGKNDLVRWQASLDGGKAMVFLSNGDGTFTKSVDHSNAGATSGLESTKFYFADVNGDGKADKIYWNASNNLGEPKIYLGTSTTFESPVYSLRGTSQKETTNYYFEDINGDGKADQIRWNPTENNGAIKTYSVR